MDLVLASASPRRIEIVRRLGFDVLVVPARVDETPLEGEAPETLVARLARLKASTVARDHPGRHVLGGDTVVVLDGTVLGKPRDEAHAVEMLQRLSGRTHDVLTALALATPSGVHSRVDRAGVRFRDASREELRGYVATGEPMDKAGAYGIQGGGGALVEGVDGDYYTVVGLSVFGLVELLRTAGWRLAASS